jgi:Tfp pilus assembly protein PilN
VVIFASNGATAAKLKLMLPTLLKQLSERATEVTGLEVAVQARESSDQVTEKSAKMSQQAASELAALSEQLPDSELKDAVSRIVFQHRC